MEQAEARSAAKRDLLNGIKIQRQQKRQTKRELNQKKKDEAKRQKTVATAITDPFGAL